ncbi:MULTISPECIES: hypothetical protein [Actinokineospora]|uniref:Uncharacterized protein n=1 Tax=Actinokineospora fastidiosa TaxID=1816 RepID=A0A918GCZ2_9PSEU|nr:MULTISPECIES: hypothetical protein [Actinokineospora]UVS79514.1 hypothetical protein Actkin_03264 [Actinokineospora sp. UTMC 2448]GGS29237.1 hypothetical protein GCM10010171_23120 [Actinokineospora fastidiosa]
MRTTCLVLGTLSLLMSAIWVGIGLLDLLAGGPSTSSPAVTGLRMNAASAAAIDLRGFDFGTTSTLAQVSAIAGVGWMIAASAFKPAQTAPSTTPDGRHWQPPLQNHPAPQAQPYAPQWQQQAPPHQHPEQQS